MSDAPERLWCWDFQTAEGSWGKGWGGYARQENRRPIDEREGNTGAEYVRADLYAAQAAKIARLTAERDAALAGARKAHDALWELNPNNYDHDEVCKLNDGAIEAILTLAPLIGETHGYSPEWWNQRAAIQPNPDARQADLAKAATAALRDIDDLVANSEGVSGLHLNGDVAPWSEIMDGGAYGAWLQSVERLREAIRALTPPADLAAKIGGAE